MLEFSKFKENTIKRRKIIKKFKETVQLYAFIFRFSFQIVRVEMLFILLGGLLSTAMLAINLFVPKYIIDHINTSPLEELIFYAILLIFANLLLLNFLV